MNTHIRDNLNALKTPASAIYNGVEGTDLNLTSTTWADMDATEGKFQHTITTNGGDIMVGFSGSFVGNANLIIYLDVAIDGVAWGVTTLGAAEGLQGVLVSNTATVVEGSVNLFRIIAGISAGAHTFKMRYKISAGTITLFRAAGTASADIVPQFWVREIS